MASVTRLDSVEAGMPLVFGGNRIVHVPDSVARQFRPGDSIVVVEATAEVLLIGSRERAVAEHAVEQASAAFPAMSRAPEERISEFYRVFADRLADDAVWSRIRRTNEGDVEDALRRGRSTTRLEATDKLRQLMIEGLRGWISATSQRDRIIETVKHDNWEVDLIGAALGAVGFVFEGRPNVVADATGVLRGGNTVVFRIGRDALATARAIKESALDVALKAAELPAGAVALVESTEHASGWALFLDKRLALAVARGSGPAVATLGALARQAGVPVSLHGTGGAWLFASDSAKVSAFGEAVFRSLDRKVCNTLNTCCIPRSRAAELVPELLDALERAGNRLGQSFKLHATDSARTFLPETLFEQVVSIARAGGDVREHQVERIAESDLGKEFEWEQTPEVSLAVVDDLSQAMALFNRYSPRFTACLVSDDPAEHEVFYQSIDAPFVGDGFTRWVDGQFALRRPELGLSNWQDGRLFGRGGILSGNTVFTIRTRARTTRA